MKKRILCIVLVAVMLLAMIPALSVAAEDPAINTVMDYRYYRTVITADTILVDGKLDETYKNSQKITGSASGVAFEAYTAVTLQGLYVWAEVNGDTFTVYNLMADGRKTVWGWYEIKNDGTVTKISKETTELLDAKVMTETLDSSKFVVEIFIPAAVQLLNFTNYNLSLAFSAKSGSTVCYDQYRDEDRHSASNKPEDNYANYKPLRLVKWIDRISYSPTYVYQTHDIYTNDDVPVYGELINSAVYTQGSAFTIDGKKDAHYSEHNKIPLITWITYVDGNANPLATPVPNMGYVYVAFDDSNLYVYYERYDEDLTNNEQLTTNYYFDDGEKITAGGFNVMFKQTYTGAWGSENANYGWPAGSTPQTGMTYGRIFDETTHLHGVEYKMPLPDGIKEKLANDEDVSFKISFNTKDESSSGSKINLAGSHHNSENFYQFNQTGSEFINPKNYGTTMILSKSNTKETGARILYSNLTLGTDITVNYYATIGTGDIYNTYMKFTLTDANGAKKDFVAYPRKVDGETYYKFSFTGMAPHHMGDKIDAQLIIDGEIVDEENGYSARQNCINLLKTKECGPDNVKMNNFIKALLNYGAAAQTYLKYNTENLVDKGGYGIKLSAPTDQDNVRRVEKATSDDINMTAMGVYFDNDNRIYVKFYAKSLEGVTVTFNGKKAAIEVSNASKNEYIAYSDGIPVTQFGILYEIVLSNGNGSQVAKYSVNSYAYAKLSSANEAMVELAKATYTYGDAAKKYAGIGDTVYTVMTYNDASNNEPYKNKHDNVLEIINDCSPDLIGMQEVQVDQVKYYLPTNRKEFSTNCFTGENGDYAGIFFWAEPAYHSSWSKNVLADEGKQYKAYLGECSNRGGDMILYNKNKFEIVQDADGNAVRHFWFADDDPTKPGVYSDTIYTQCFMYVVLKDKETGNEFVFVNTHLSTKEAARNKQVQQLLDIMETENLYNKHTGTDGKEFYVSSYRKIYTADWNFNPQSAEYKLMNNAEYFSSEDQIANCYKPSTSCNGAHIDFCFTKTSEFKAIEHKVLNDHPLAIETSDHYPVLSKLVWSQEYNDVELYEKIFDYPELPDNPSFDEHDDFFFTDDDTEGFVPSKQNFN